MGKTNSKTTIFYVFSVPLEGLFSGGRRALKVGVGACQRKLEALGREPPRID